MTNDNSTQLWDDKTFQYCCNESKKERANVGKKKYYTLLRIE